MCKRSNHPANRLLVTSVLCAACAFAQTNYNQAPPQAVPQQGAPPQGAPPQGSAIQAQYPRPGSLNYLEGQVSSNGQPLSLQSVGRFALQARQALQTGPNGYAEVLLTPGAFLRVGPNTTFHMAAVGLADCRVMLDHGSAMIEADQIIEGTHVEVTMGQTSVDLLKKGLYAFTTDPPELRTFDGKEEVVGQTKSVDIGKSDQILLAGNPELKKTHFDRNAAKNEPLYAWSQARSRAESEENQRVAQNSSAYMPVGDGWFWDPYLDYYGFWGPGYLYSPFGFGFYGGFYPGFYGGFHGGGYRRGFVHRGPVRYGGVHGNGVGGFHGGWHEGGGFHGGAFHGGGGRR
ncbi:MAG TPA: hypothetical protein VH302_11575 [Bryobacteraceae bacterium]|nr:hypothetical protein [Bryobacteraceae bacterium]